MWMGIMKFLHDDSLHTLSHVIIFFSTWVCLGSAKKFFFVEKCDEMYLWGKKKFPLTLARIHNANKSVRNISSMVKFEYMRDAFVICDNGAVWFLYFFQHIFHFYSEIFYYFYVGYCGVKNRMWKLSDKHQIELFKRWKML